MPISIKQFNMLEKTIINNSYISINDKKYKLFSVVGKISHINKKNYINKLRMFIYDFTD